MKRVIALAPYEISNPNFFRYLERAFLDSIDHNESPLFPEVFYNIFLDSENVAYSDTIIQHSITWLKARDRLIVYDDYGRTSIMKGTIEWAEENEKDIQVRKIGMNPQFNRG